MQKVKCPKCHFIFSEDIKPGVQEASCTCPRCGSPFTFITDNDNIQPNVSIQSKSLYASPEETVSNKEQAINKNISDKELVNPDEPLHSNQQSVCLPIAEDNSVAVQTDIDTTTQVQKTKWWKSKIAKILFKCIAYIVIILVGVAVVFIVGRIAFLIFLALVFFISVMSKK
jgi:hypothetical protein